MASFSFASTKRTSPRPEAPVRFVSVVVAALVLTGCNANQAINPCGRDPYCNPYDPTSYAQNNTGIGGGGH